MRVCLQTRGRTLDYAFLGENPEERWWSQYRNQTAFEDPTILVHSEGGRWQICLSGIGSTRKDRVGTIIRYTLVLDGECRDEGAGESAGAAVGAWLADAAAKQPFGSIQAALDAEFSEAFVEEVLGDRSPKSAATVSQKATTALERLTTGASARHVSTNHGSWVGSLAMQHPREAFMDRVHELLAGDAGRALLLNLIATEDEARSVVERRGATAILIEDGAEVLGSGVVPLEKKKSQAPTRPPRPSAPRRTSVVAVTIFLFLLASLLWLFLGATPM